MTAGLNLLVANIFTEHQTRDIKIGTFHTSVRVLTCPTWLCDVLVTPHTVVTTDSEPGAWLAFCCHGTESYGKDPSLKTKQTHQLNEIYKKKAMYGEMNWLWGRILSLVENIVSQQSKALQRFTRETFLGNQSELRPWLQNVLLNITSLSQQFSSA